MKNSNTYEELALSEYNFLRDNKDFVIECNGLELAIRLISDLNIMDPLYKAKDLMRIVSGVDAESWRVYDKTVDKLPQWFIDACRPEMTKEEADNELERWRRLSEEEKAVYDHKIQWSALNWLHAMQPSEREWYWVGAKVLSEKEALVIIKISESPAPLGSLSWLFNASGASLKNFP